MKEGDQKNVDTDTIYTLHLFAGAGGGILGDLLLGHIPVGAVEIEAYPRKVLLARQLDGSLPQFPIWDDVCTFRSDNPDTSSYIERLRGIRDGLCICGGFPCQDISCAGKGAGIDGERSGLWREFARIIGEIRPAFVFVENSPMLLIRGATRVIADLAGMGYVGRNGVLGVGDAGGMHQRNRIWILAHSDNRKERNKRIFKKEIRGQPGFSWCKNVRGVKDLFNRPDLYPPPLCRVYDGLDCELDQVAAVGNGQCPQVVKLAWEVLR